MCVCVFYAKKMKEAAELFPLCAKKKIAHRERIKKKRKNFYKIFLNARQANEGKKSQNRQFLIFCLAEASSFYLKCTHFYCFHITLRTLSFPMCLGSWLTLATHCCAVAFLEKDFFAELKKKHFARQHKRSMNLRSALLYCDSELC